jgi:hypothetical protein
LASFLGISDFTLRFADLGYRFSFISRKRISGHLWCRVYAASSRVIAVVFRVICILLGCELIRGHIGSRHMPILEAFFSKADCASVPFGGMMVAKAMLHHSS